MDLMTLLDRAAESELDVQIEGDRVRIRGPKAAESIAKELLDRKAELLAWWRHPGAGIPIPDVPVSPDWLPRDLPWRQVLAEWPIELRERWGRRANDFEDAGLAWFEAEQLAFEDITHSVQGDKTPSIHVMEIAP